MRMKRARNGLNLLLVRPLKVDEKNQTKRAQTLTIAPPPPLFHWISRRGQVTSLIHRAQSSHPFNFYVLLFLLPLVRENLTAAGWSVFVF